MKNDKRFIHTTSRKKADEFQSQISPNFRRALMLTGKYIDQHTIKFSDSEGPHAVWKPKSFHFRVNGEVFDVRRIAFCFLNNTFLPAEADVDRYCKQRRCISHQRLK